MPRAPAPPGTSFFLLPGWSFGPSRSNHIVTRKSFYGKRPQKSQAPCATKRRQKPVANGNAVESTADAPVGLQPMLTSARALIAEPQLRCAVAREAWIVHMTFM
jgi:hypothetical protein